MPNSCCHAEPWALPSSELAARAPIAAAATIDRNVRVVIRCLLCVGRISWRRRGSPSPPELGDDGKPVVRLPDDWALVGAVVPAKSLSGKEPAHPEIHAEPPDAEQLPKAKDDVELGTHR